MNVPFTLGRVALVVLFILSGAQKLTDIAGTADQIQAKLTIPSALADVISQVEATVGMPISQILAIVAAMIEVVGGLLIAFNVFTRTMAVVLLIFTAVTTFYMHDFWNMPAGADRTNNMIHALKNLSIMGGLLILAAWPRRAVIVEEPGHERIVGERVEPL
ncbi:MAG: DoxX family protein [Xanthobacteraceae bacterium]|jgi:putative oxidoreductase